MKNRIESDRASQSRVRNVLGGAAILTAALLVAAPYIAEAEEAPDRDPFDRPGFYIGAGASYQYNAFSSQIEDVIEDEFTVKTDVDLEVLGKILAKLNVAPGIKTDGLIEFQDHQYFKSYSELTRKSRREVDDFLSFKLQQERAQRKNKPSKDPRQKKK